MPRNNNFALQNVFKGKNSMNHKVQDYDWNIHEENYEKRIRDYYCGKVNQMKVFSPCSYTFYILQFWRVLLINFIRVETFLIAFLFYLFRNFVETAKNYSFIMFYCILLEFSGWWMMRTWQISQIVPCWSCFCQKLNSLSNNYI